jgi:hypothetical protein
MNLIDRFRLAFQGKKLASPKEPGPVPGLPSIQEDDIDFILSEHALRKWGDVEFYGPGAEEAYARRNRALGIKSPKKEAEEIEAKEEMRHASSKKPGKRKSNKRASLLRKKAKLEKEIEKLERNQK